MREEFEKALDAAKEQLTQLREKAPDDMQPKVNMAFASLTACKLRIEEGKRFDEALYLFGRVQWTIGFITGRRGEPDNTKTLTEVFSKDNSDDDTPILDSLLGNSKR